MRRMIDHRTSAPSPIAGLKPYLFAGVIVVVGLLVVLNFLMNDDGQLSGDVIAESIVPSEGGLVPGAIAINPGSDSRSPEEQGESATETNAAVAEVITPSEFTFYEILKKRPDEPAGTVDLTPKSVSSPSTAPTDGSSTKKAVTRETPKHTARLIETTAIDRTTLHYTVQVAAFQKEALAEELKGTLATKGHDAYLVSAKLRDGMTYRVRVGHFATRDEAIRVAQTLAKQEGFHPFIATVQPNF